MVCSVILALKWRKNYQFHGVLKIILDCIEKSFKFNESILDWGELLEKDVKKSTKMAFRFSIWTILSETVDIWFISAALSLRIILMSMRRKCYIWEHIPLHAVRYVPRTITAKFYSLTNHCRTVKKTCPMPGRNPCRSNNPRNITSASKINALFHLQLYIL